MTIIRRALIGMVAGAAIFLACAYSLGAIFKSMPEPHPALAQDALKAALVVISLGAWAAMRRPWSEMGWRRPERAGRVIRWYILAIVSMGLASIAMILSKSKHPAVAGFSFPELILTVWIISSISEEIFVRGLVQSWIAAGAETPPLPADHRIIVASSAILFASMHVPLIWKGAGPIGGGVIVCATFGVGWAAAELRARTRSLWHAIGVHIVGNVAALPFGVLGVILYRIIYHEMPVR